MTNSEIKQALYCAKESAEITLCEECKLYETCDHSTRKDIAQIWIEALEENDKLKAEIEQLKNDLNNEREWIAKFKTDYEQLKSELEQSVRLPCKIGDALFCYCSAFGQILEYVLDYVVIDEKNTIYSISAYSKQIGDCMQECLDELEIEYSDFGKTVFLSIKEAEQHLKGKV